MKSSRWIWRNITMHNYIIVIKLPCSLCPPSLFSVEFQCHLKAFLVRSLLGLVQANSIAFYAIENEKIIRNFVAEVFSAALLAFIASCARRICCQALLKMARTPPTHPPHPQQAFHSGCQWSRPRYVGGTWSAELCRIMWQPLYWLFLWLPHCHLCSWWRHSIDFKTAFFHAPLRSSFPSWIAVLMTACSGPHPPLLTGHFGRCLSLPSPSGQKFSY